MGLEIVRRIRGNIHGSIDLSILEDKVMAHPIFQRLRRIHQTAFLSYTFPGATHTRFEHSIGVLHLAKISWQKLASNQERLSRSAAKHKDFQSKEQVHLKSNHGFLYPTFAKTKDIFESDYIFQCIRLAAMLHDIGHPPFSHSGERFLPTLDKILSSNDDIPEYISEYLHKKIKDNEQSGKSSSKLLANHETYTLLLIHQILNDIYLEENIDLKIDPRDVIAIIESEIKPELNSPLLKHSVLQLCHELISGEFDIDRMDYLRRDSKESGVIYGIFDADRILDSLSIYSDNEGSFHLAIQYSGLAAFEDYLRARQSMYLQLYFHKTSVAAEANLQNLMKNLESFTLPANIKEYVKFDDFSIYHYLKNNISNMKFEIEKESKLFKKLDDLLLNRKLWKRVFELTGNSNAVRHRPEMEKVKKILKDSDVEFEQISSKSNLTNFRPRSSDEKSRNYLRLIKKDASQFPRVVPIEDHTNLISEQNTVHISRIYVENCLNKEGKKNWEIAIQIIDNLFSES